MTATRVLRIGASREELQRAEQEIDAMAQQQGWAEEMLFKVKLAVEELGLNIIDYGYEGDEAREIEIRFHHGDAELTIEIIDEAEAFDPLVDPPAPDTSAGIEERKIGGLGIHLVKEIMDEVSYCREGCRNRLTLKMRHTA
ncbi:ATP-binding protein [Candidatus Foliamicus sp.]